MYRSVNLAHFLQPHKIHFLLEDYGGAKKVLLENGYKKIRILKKSIDMNSDINETINYINNKKINVLIIDLYGVKLKYLKEVGKFAKIVVISDLWNVEYTADLVVNGFIGFRNKIIKNRYGARCLLGPNYQILNKGFIGKNASKKEYQLIVTFGGFDDNNIAEVLLKVLTKYLKKIKTKIILGPSTTESCNIKSLKKKYRSRLQIIQKTCDMYKEISRAEYGICSGGITSYEFAAVGIPFGIISQVKHQLTTAREWQRRGIALNLGLVNNEIQVKINRFLKNIAENKMHGKINTKEIIDGRGGERVAKEILEL